MRHLSTMRFCCYLLHKLFWVCQLQLNSNGWHSNSSSLNLLWKSVQNILVMWSLGRAPEPTCTVWTWPLHTSSAICCLLHKLLWACQLLLLHSNGCHFNSGFCRDYENNNVQNNNNTGCISCEIITARSMADNTYVSMS